MKHFNEIFIPFRFYGALSAIVILFIFGFFFDIFLLAAKLVLCFFILFLIIDIILLYFRTKNNLLLRRELPGRFSNGDENSVKIFLINQNPFTLALNIYDEVPVEFQLRNFKMTVRLKAYEEKMVSYTLKPLTRGEYVFGHTNVIFHSVIGLIARKAKFGNPTDIVRVYPSFLRMRKYELLAISNRLSEAGIKKVRRIGTHSEFDQIKDYVKGDNYRTINWKATAKLSKLMVNQYQEERSQNVYNVIDKGRLMQLPFNGMSLLDHAINSSLIISNIVLQKHDRAGLISFNKNIDSFVRAQRRNETIHLLLENLYNQKTEFHESDYALLSSQISRRISTRSLLILYTNFETLTSLNQHLKYFKSISGKHVLIIVIFQNEEIKALSRQKAEKIEDIYVKTIAEKYIHDKKLIIKELNKNGIYSLLTKPEDLSVKLINKYLELKGTGRF